MKVLLDLRPLQGREIPKARFDFIFEVSRGLVSRLNTPFILWSDVNAEKGVMLRREFERINPKAEHEVLVFDGIGQEEISSKREPENLLLFELLFEWKVSEIDPDVLLIFSFFEREHPSSIGKLKKRWKNFVTVCEEILKPYNFEEKVKELKRADLFFVTSEKIKRRLSELEICEEKIRVLTYPLDQAVNTILRALEEEACRGVY